MFLKLFHVVTQDVSKLPFLSLFSRYWKRLDTVDCSEIPNNHLLSMKPYEKLDILHINWCRIPSSNSTICLSFVLMYPHSLISLPPCSMIHQNHLKPWTPELIFGCLQLAKVDLKWWVLPSREFIHPDVMVQQQQVFVDTISLDLRPGWLQDDIFQLGFIPI